MRCFQTPTVISYLFAVSLIGQVAAAEDLPTQDVTFATVDGQELKLNLFLPEKTENPPLVVFIHGGGWRNGSFKNCQVKWLTDYGCAVASIGYRLSDKGIFPAQIHDCKAAIRWLRAHATDYQYDATHIVVAGTSAGGHLALLLGVTGDNAELEGTVGGNNDESSRVQGIVDYFGPSDFLLRSRNQPAKTEDPNGSVTLLLGGKVSENHDLAKLASPAHHVTPDDPPLLILHGENDKTVYIGQAQRMEQAYKEAGLDVAFIVIPGAGHGGQVFFTEEYRKPVVEFIKSQQRSDIKE